VLSFHGTKFFNTNEGGAILTNDDALARKMRLMRNFGFASFDNVVSVGTNGKLTEVSAAMGLTNLESLDAFVTKNRSNYHHYRDAFESIASARVLPYDETEGNNFQYIVLEVEEGARASRDELVAALHAENILARKYFWPGAHRMQPYAALYPHAELLLPHTRTVADRVIVLPTGTAISSEMIDTIASVFRVLLGPK
jgi:dTDP-4-amino-4,6-dideoxygalactose transaminase